MTFRLKGEIVKKTYNIEGKKRGGREEGKRRREGGRGKSHDTY
jgi:hypothetical protein